MKVAVKKINVVEGEIDRIPQVGECLWLGNDFRTSRLLKVYPMKDDNGNVTEALLKTKNSTYLMLVREQ